MFRPGFYAFIVQRVLRSVYFATNAYRVSKKAPRITIGSNVRIRDTDGLIVSSDVIIGDDAEMGPATSTDQPGWIELGRRVKIGKRVQLKVAAGGHIRVGDNSSIHNGSIILGNVSIGRHCLISLNVFMSSGDHHARLRPTWLIRDQDDLAKSDETLRPIRSLPIVIADDCWIGWGAVIKRGIYIGRGALIGANAVVTKDVPPYSVQGGVPSRELSRRAEFTPPATIDANNDQHWPYFYAGFSRSEQDAGSMLAHRDAMVVLASGGCSILMVEGSSFTKIQVAVTVSGQPVGIIDMTEGSFIHKFQVPPKSKAIMQGVPSVLSHYRVVRMQVQEQPGISSDSRLYALRRVSLIENDGFTKT